MLIKCAAWISGMYDLLNKCATKCIQIWLKWKNLIYFLTKKIIKQLPSPKHLTLDGPNLGCRRKEKNCHDPEFFPSTIVRRSAYVRNLFKMQQKTVNTTTWVQTQKKESFCCVVCFMFRYRKKICVTTSISKIRSDFKSCSGPTFWGWALALYNQNLV